MQNKFFFFIFFLAGFLLYAKETQRFTILDEYPLIEITEPSGLCYNSVKNTLFVVGDQGDVAEISMEGEVLNHKFYSGRDFEGITISGSVLYALDENNFHVLKLDPDSLDLISVHGITTEYGTFEGISVHPDGSILLVNQVRKLKNLKAGILFLDPGTLLPDGRFIETEIVDQAGIFPATDELNYYIISDRKNRLYSYSLTEGHLWDIPLPGVTQEGIALDAEGGFYIAQDRGGILLLELEW